MAEQWGWASNVETFLSTPKEVWLASLTDHHTRLWRQRPSGSQVRAWGDEYDIVFDSLKLCVTSDPSLATRWSVAFEYELPLEGGRRPDVVVLTGGSVTVLEFKSSGICFQPDVDQTIGYARDLHDYHSGSEGRPCNGILVLAGAKGTYAELRDEIPVVDRGSLARYLIEFGDDGSHDLDLWLNSHYQPLPTLVEAARRIFRNEDLPHVHTAIAAGIPATVELLGSIVDECAEVGKRALAFVTGVPGAGKTLVGLRLVHDRTEKHGRATFLSGNGPLVQVLQDALKSRVFVRNLHQFIQTYGMGSKEKIPDEHVIVFDEAQRAWDEEYMLAQRQVARSEPSLLLEVGDRIPDWSTLVGLVGEGQEIHSGEEAGIEQWRDAVVERGAGDNWTVHCSPRVVKSFDGVEVKTHPELDLNLTLRSRRAEDLHAWVQHLLIGSLSMANSLSSKIRRAQYPLYVTRSLELAKGYARRRYVDEPDKRFGLLASSHAKDLERHGVRNGFMATSRMNIAKWYNAPGEDPAASNALAQPVTEFGCQGLELDLPIVCWGSDLRWADGEWSLRPVRRRYQQDDPEGLLRNAYRVLLTRGRDGLVIFLPPDKDADTTEHALLAAGVEQLVDREIERFALPAVEAS